MLASLRKTDRIFRFRQRMVRPQTETGSAAQVIADFAQIGQLADEWRALETALETPLQSYIFAQACADSVCSQSAPHFMVHRKGQELAALAPLIQQGTPFSPLRMIGVHELYEPSGFIYSDSAALEALVEKIRKLGVVLFMDRIFADSPTLLALHKAFHGHAWIFTQPADFCPYIPLNQEWIEPLHHFNGRRRSDFRRAQHKAESLGSVSYEILCPTSDTLDRVLDEAYRVEAGSWKNNAGSALLIDQRRGEFFRHYAHRASDEGTLRICFLRINGLAVAMQIAIESASRFWLLKIGFDESYAHISPGNLLMLHTVKYAALKGLQSYELLGRTDAWTRLWTTLERQCVQMHIYPHTRTGTMALTLAGVRKIWQQLKNWR